MDVLVLHNTTFSSIHASFKQLHCRLNVLGSKAINSFWDILQKYELKGSLNTVSDCSIGKESTSEWEEINPNTGKTYHKGEMQTSPLITKCIMKNKHFLLFVNNWTDYTRYFCFTSLLFCNLVTSQNPFPLQNSLFSKASLPYTLPKHFHSVPWPWELASHHPPQSLIHSTFKPKEGHPFITLHH